MELPIKLINETLARLLRIKTFNIVHGTVLIRVKRKVKNLFFQVPGLNVIDILHDIFFLYFRLSSIHNEKEQ